MGPRLAIETFGSAKRQPGDRSSGIGSSGSKGLNGYGAEHLRIEPQFAVKGDAALGALGVLLEPTSIVAKAWHHVERMGQCCTAASAEFNLNLT